MQIDTEKQRRGMTNGGRRAEGWVWGVEYFHAFLAASLPKSPWQEVCTGLSSGQQTTDQFGLWSRNPWMPLNDKPDPIQSILICRGSKKWTLKAYIIKMQCQIFGPPLLSAAAHPKHIVSPFRNSVIHIKLHPLMVAEKPSQYIEQATLKAAFFGQPPTQISIKWGTWEPGSQALWVLPGTF